MNRGNFDGNSLQRFLIRRGIDEAHNVRAVYANVVLDATETVNAMCSRCYNCFVPKAGISRVERAGSTWETSVFRLGVCAYDLPLFHYRKGSATSLPVACKPLYCQTLRTFLLPRLNEAFLCDQRCRLELASSRCPDSSYISVEQ